MKVQIELGDVAFNAIRDYAKATDVTPETLITGILSDAMLHFIAGKMAAVRLIEKRINERTKI